MNPELELSKLRGELSECRHELKAECNRLKAEVERELKAHAMVCTVFNRIEAERDQLRAEVERLKETHIMQLAAISVAANSNTDSTIKEALKCHPDYKTVALSVVVVAVEREVWERNQKDQWRAVAEQAIHAIKEGNNHGYGLRIGDDALAAYEKLKGTSP